MQRDERSGTKPARDSGENPQGRTVNRSPDGSDGSAEITTDERVDLTLDSPDGYPWLEWGREGRDA